MLFSPSEWYEHYAAFAAPFLVVLVALSAARLFAPGQAPKSPPGQAGKSAPGRARSGRWVRASAAVVAVLAVAAMGAADGYAVTKLYPARDLSAASALIPPGACVLTDTASVTIAIDRFTASAPGCPALVDAVGTLIATTDGRDFVTGPAGLAADTRAWQVAFSHAEYVWLIGNNGYTGARIAWTPALHAYFTEPLQAHRAAQLLPRARQRPGRRRCTSGPRRRPHTEPNRRRFRYVPAWTISAAEGPMAMVRLTGVSVMS